MFDSIEAPSHTPTGSSLMELRQSELPPDGLSSMAPGPELARVLAGVDRERLSGHDRVEVLKARSRQVAHDQAELLADMVSVLDAETETLAITVDPDTARKRYEDGLDGRKVTSEANDDGTDNLYGWHLPPEQTRAIMRRINRMPDS